MKVNAISVITYTSEVCEMAGFYRSGAIHLNTCSNMDRFYPDFEKMNITLRAKKIDSFHYMFLLLFTQP